MQTVREKFSCRECETITQPPAPFHVTPRGFAGPNLLAMILFEKFGQHQPLNRQSERYRREGIELSVSTLADQIGACAAVLQPLKHGIEFDGFAVSPQLIWIVLLGFAMMILLQLFFRYTRLGIAMQAEPSNTPAPPASP